MDDILKNFVVIALAFVACGCDEQPMPTAPSGPPGSTGMTVRGRVVDYGTRSAATGVAIQLVSEWDSRVAAAERKTFRATTDASGAYALTVPVAGPYSVTANGEGLGVAHVTGPAYRGDLFTVFTDATGQCRARYGTLADARTGSPIAGARVSLGGPLGGPNVFTSGPDGWYHLDYTCLYRDPASNFNTTFMFVDHPNYVPVSVGIGRGIHFVIRIDLDLQPR